MRFMSMVKAKESKFSPPPKALMEAIDQLLQDIAKEGCVMVQAGGLFPTQAGARVRLADGKVTVIDGPFTEAKEVVGGYAIVETKTREEAMEIAHKFMDLHRVHWPEFEGESEVRPMEEYTPQ